MKLTPILNKLDPRIEAKYFFYIRDNVEPGDILFTRTPLKLYNLIIPGYWTHCSIYLGGDKFQIIDANANGVTIRTLPDLWTYISEVAIASPKCSYERKQEAVDFCLGNIGKEYDYLFRSNRKAFYCSELIYNSYKDNLKMKRHMGIKSISPQDLYEDDFFDVYLSSRP